MTQSKINTTRIFLTKEIIDELHAQKERTGVGEPNLLKGAQGVPEGLSVGVIRKWLYKETKTAHQHHLDYVLTAGKACQIAPTNI